MSKQSDIAITNALLKYIPQSLCNAVQDGLIEASRRAYDRCKGMDEGHLKSALGQLRHFYSNELFALALASAGIKHNQVRGNDIIVGTSGPLLLSRFNTTDPRWRNAARSKRRLELADRNQWLEALIQPGLFSQAISQAEMAVFFVASYSTRFPRHHEPPISIDIAVMDTQLSESLFKESLHVFKARYNAAPAQPDKVVPKLKSVVHEKKEGSS